MCSETPLFDMKCEEACKYCSGKCDNCMEKTSFDRGPKLGYHVWETIRFCSEECLEHYRFHRSSSDAQILVVASIDATRLFLTVRCGLLNSELERSKVVAHLYKGSDSQDDKEKVYVLLQVRFVPKQRFLSFVLADDFSPGAVLPNSVLFTDEDLLITAGFQSVMKNFCTKFNFSGLYSFLSSMSSTPAQLLKVPPLCPSLECLPDGFEILKEEQSIICPDLYSIVLHKTRETHTTCLLTNSAAEYFALFYNFSEDYEIKAVYTVESSPAAIAMKRLKSKPLLSSYNELILECCKNIACVELTSMLQEREVDSLEAFITGYR